MRTQHETIGPCLSRTLLRLAASASFVVLVAGLAACRGESSSSRPESDPDGRAGVALQAARPTFVDFDMVRSTAAANAGCLADAKAEVRIRSVGPVEVMDVDVRGLPPNTEFDLFVIQVPDSPFGLAWYQGDIETNHNGKGHQTFIGRFSIETFIVAPGTTPAPAPVVHDQPPFPDADSNPLTPPVHTFHLGLWFDNPADAAAAGCPSTVTPFNGDHNAGVQALSTRNFEPENGPLRQVQ